MRDRDASMTGPEASFWRRLQGLLSPLFLLGLVLFAFSLPACGGDEGSMDEAMEEMQDEFDDAKEELEDEIDDHM